jgi:hypothetical protein
MRSITGSDPNWGIAVLELAEDKNFSSFRTHKMILRVIEGTPKYAGKHAIRKAKKRNSQIFMKEFAKSENVGSPLNTLPLMALNTKLRLSPTTARYINNLNNMDDVFCLETLTRIVEIGGGYGGEQKIISDFFKLSNFAPPEYLTFDQEASFPLIRKFLEVFDYKLKIARLTDTFKADSDTLVISNAAFSEMDSELQTLYFSSVIRHAKYGYFISNFESHSRTFGGWSNEEFLRQLHAAGKYDAEILRADNFLTVWDSKSNSELILFGHSNLPRAFRLIMYQSYLSYYLRFLLRKVSQKINYHLR